jgi:hypothetical protein
MPTTYTVKRGDNLSKIAKSFGYKSWHDIYFDKSNGDFRRLRPDPNLIYPGDTLVLPGKADAPAAPALGGVAIPSPVFVMPGDLPPLGKIWFDIPPNLKLSQAQLERILGEDQLRDVLRNLPPTQPQPNAMDELAKKFGKYLSPTVGDYQIKPDYGMLWQTLQALKKAAKL